MPRLLGLFVAFAAVIGVVVLRPDAHDAVAALQTETATVTGTPPTSTPSTTATTSPSATPTTTATPGPSAAPVIKFPTSQCVGGTTLNPASANVHFTWTGPTNVSAIYLDLSIFDNTFADGTYITIVLPAGTTEFTWTGIVPGLPHHWRVTGQGLNGDWVSSTFGRFTPCGTQRLLNIEYSCTGAGRATVVFRWAPASSPGFFQFVDLSLFNNNFAPNTFIGGGPHAGDVQALLWPGIIANAVHYFRVNTFSVFGWGPSQTGSFVAQCSF